MNTSVGDRSVRGGENSFLLYLELHLHWHLLAKKQISFFQFVLMVYCLYILISGNVFFVGSVVVCVCLTFLGFACGVCLFFKEKES